MTEALERLDTHQVAAAAAACVRAERAAGCQLLELAALWADHHPANGVLHQFTDLAVAGHESATFGGDGTPDVAEFAPAELGLEIGMNPYQARNLIADAALDLRHRFPRLWTRIQAGQVPAKDARQVALRTRLLTQEQAMIVDRRIARLVGQLSWTRLDHLLRAEIQRVDRERIAEQTDKAKQYRGVHVGRGSECGLTAVWMQLDTLTALRMKAQLVRLASVMMAHTDQLPAGVQTLGARTRHEWEAVAAGLDRATALQVLALADQPDLFTDLEPFLRAAAARLAEPAEATPDQSSGSPVPRPTELGGTAAELADQDLPSPAELREMVMKDLARRIDPEKLLPKVVLHVHLSAVALRPFGPGEDPGVARVEGAGPVLLSTVRECLGAGCRVTVLPVLDPDGIPAVDAYEIPDRMAEAVLGRSPGSVFPWSGVVDRHRLDLDHTIPYTGPPGGPPGQTRMGNLGPLSRGEHRFKTFGRITVRQPAPGTFVWRTRFGRIVITNPAGTHDLGTGAFADAVWRASIDRRRSRVA